jgi:pimeloyl-ACP methyl ester carboxylesterase
MPTARLPWFTATDHTFAVPLDHRDPDGEKIEVYAREVRARDGRERPWLLFLQGGPGMKSPRPCDLKSWLGPAVMHFTVLLLDQRGTGRSSPVNRQTLARFGSPGEQAAYLTHFRADAIVADCEAIRRELLGPHRTWSVLGQSFGGFCATTYLSLHPEGLDRVLITGGVPPLDGGPDVVYRHTYPNVLRRSAAYYERYPEDEPALAAIRDHLAANDVRLLNGDRLPVERLQQLGHGFGMADGFEHLHYLVEEAWAGKDELSDTFLFGVEERTSFTVSPIYALLHEPIYAQGEASGWSAERLLAQYPALAPDQPRVSFTGEMIYPWMFDINASLAPLKAAAEVLAAKDDWPALYDPARLAANNVPVAALVNYDDMYVARELSLETAARIRGAKTWITSEYEHDALHRDSERVINRLLHLATS